MDVSQWEAVTCLFFPRGYVHPFTTSLPTLTHPAPLPPDTPSQRVQFILGTEEDEEHAAHDLFTELDEICVKDGKDAEWKETARWERVPGRGGVATRPAIPAEILVCPYFVYK